MTDNPISPYSVWVNALAEVFCAMVPAASSDAGAASPGKAAFENASPLTSLFQGLVPDGQRNPSGASQLLLGIERTFGGLAGALGLEPMRELGQAWREMLVAIAAKQRAQVEYLDLVAQAWNTGTQGLVQDLQAMATRGERVESLLAFIRMWATSVEGPLHETMQGKRGLEVTAKVIRASTQYRLQSQKAIGIVSEALNVPTRADMDDAFREIQELKRELRRLTKALPPAVQKMSTQTGKP